MKQKKLISSSVLFSGETEKNAFKIQAKNGILHLPEAILLTEVQPAAHTMNKNQTDV